MYNTIIYDTYPEEICHAMNNNKHDKVPKQTTKCQRLG